MFWIELISENAKLRVLVWAVWNCKLRLLPLFLHSDITVKQLLELGCKDPCLLLQCYHVFISDGRNFLDEVLEEWKVTDKRTVTRYSRWEILSTDIPPSFMQEYCITEGTLATSWESSSVSSNIHSSTWGPPFLLMQWKQFRRKLFNSKRSLSHWN